MKNTHFFEHNPNYLSHDEMLDMLNSNLGELLKMLSGTTSKCLHEDWKANLVAEKGDNYQHFRAVKDAELTQVVLANKDYFLSIDENNLYEKYNLARFGIPKPTSEVQNPKKLFKIVPKEVKRDLIQPDGTKTTQTDIVEEVQFDILRIPFEALTQKWQDANLDAAKFALCLVKRCVETGALEGSKEDVFVAFEKMAHDVHIEWMEREHSWADIRLLFPYEHLLVKSNGNNEKDKDRAHIISMTRELTFQPNILARNRSIVARAIQELFKNKAFADGLSPEYMEKIASISDLIQAQNEADFQSYNQFKSQVKAEIFPILNGKTQLTFEDLEKCSAIYYKNWKIQQKQIYALPKEYDASYDNLLADDERINFKNVARMEIADLIKELIKEQSLNSGLEAGANIVLNGDPEKDPAKQSTLGKRIKAKNAEDVANYTALKGNIFN